MESGTDGGFREEKFDLSGWSLWGRHNLENLAAAAAAARFAGAGHSAVQNAIITFRAPEHRFETVAVIDGITYIDDSKATNAAATVRALESTPRPVVLVAGGLGKDEDYSLLGRTVAGLAEHGMMRGVVLMGRDAGIIRDALNAQPGPGLAVEVVNTLKDGKIAMQDAVRKAMALTSAGDIILLSPACASFDMFSGYRERGHVFRAALKAIACRHNQCAGEHELCHDT